jgi:hypothetical protein
MIAGRTTEQSTYLQTEGLISILFEYILWLYEDAE